MDTDQELARLDSDTGEAEEIVVPHAVKSVAERVGIIEALIFVADEPLSAKVIAEVLKEDRLVVEEAIEALAREFNAEEAFVLVLQGNPITQRSEVVAEMYIAGWLCATKDSLHYRIR